MGDAEKPFGVSDLKEFLQGTWSLERRVEDRRAGQQGTLTGEAVFRADGTDLLYREEGRLSFGAHEGPALQVYRYGFPTAASARVFFDDGRLFHDLDLTGGNWRCTHLCAPDRYDGAFTVLNGDHWRVVWHVAGPRKDLVLDSRYRRRL